MVPVLTEFMSQKKTEMIKEARYLQMAMLSMKTMKEGEQKIKEGNGTVSGSCNGRNALSSVSTGAW